jgi:hypothetical protein
VLARDGAGRGALRELAASVRWKAAAIEALAGFLFPRNAWIDSVAAAEEMKEGVCGAK